MAHMVSSSVMMMQKSSPRPTQKQFIDITLKKQDGMLGFSISSVAGGGKRKEQHFVKSIIPGGPAAKDGKMRVGDRICEFNGIPLDGLTQDKVLDLIGKEDTVHLLLEKHGATLHGVRDIILDT